MVDLMVACYAKVFIGIGSSSVQDFVSFCRQKLRRNNGDGYLTILNGHIHK